MNELAEEFGFPSAAKLYAIAKSRGFQVTRRQVDDFVSRQGVRQIFAPRARYAGKIAAWEVNQRWFGDLIDLTAQPSAGGDRYILVVQDVFTRRLFAESLRDKRPSTVAPALERIMDAHGKPKSFESDEGPEFGRPVAALMEREGVAFSQKDPSDKNAHATLDRAIASFKQSLFRSLTAQGGEDWAQLVPKVTQALNHTPHTHLGGAAPADVERSAALQFSLKRTAADDLEHNTLLIQRRDKKLEERGAFRAPLPEGLFGRSFKPRFGDEVRDVASVQHGRVYDFEGRSFPAKRVLAVPAGSTEVKSTARFRAGGSAQTQEQTLAKLEPFRGALDKFLARKAATLNDAAAFMKEIGMGGILRTGTALSFANALRLMGYTVVISPNGGSAMVRA